MISDIISLHMFDRVFIFMTTFFMLGIMQVNMRAYYKKVYGYISPTTNDILLSIGLLACFTLPMIGLFDDQDFLIVHLRFSTVFFTSFSVYAVALATVMSRYKHRFPPSEHRNIDILKYNTYGLVMVMVAFTGAF